MLPYKKKLVPMANRVSLGYMALCHHELLPFVDENLHRSLRILKFHDLMRSVTQSNGIANSVNPVCL